MITNVKEILKNADLSILDEEAKEIISLRYDNEGNEKRTPKEVARILNTSHVAVNWAERRALMELASYSNTKVYDTREKRKKKHLTYKEMAKQTKALEDELGFRWGNEYLKELK